MEMDTKTLTIFGQRMTGYLLLRGFVLAGMRPDREGSGRNVFFFKDTPDIRRAMNDYKDFCKRNPL